MNDNEIIKALECCSIRNTNCKECPYFHKKDCVEKDALDLINRLQKENDDLFFKLQGVMWSVDKWLDGDELKQDEVNRAITMREKTLQITEELQAEIERLREGMYFERERVDNIPNLLRQAKSEAYKELAEKLYERIEQNSQFGFAYVTKKEIENVVRKL
jgi:hypothetical protein